jgi:site-specific recombinase XerD
MSPDIIRAFLAYIQQEPRRWGSNNPHANRKASQTTVFRYYTVISAFASWLIREGIIENNPCNKVRVAKPKPKVLKAIEPDDIRRLLATLNGRDFNSIRNKAILLLLLDTGLRISECINLKLADIDLDKQTLKVTRKGGRETLCRVGHKVQKAIWRYLRVRVSHSEMLWVNSSGEPIKANAIQLILSRLSKKLGITGCSAHAFRRSFAIYYLRNGGDIFTLQTLLAHSSLVMVQKYLGSLKFEDAFKQHKASSPVDNFTFK